MVLVPYRVDLVEILRVISGLTHEWIREVTVETVGFILGYLTRQLRTPG